MNTYIGGGGRVLENELASNKICTILRHMVAILDIFYDTSEGKMDIHYYYWYAYDIRLRTGSSISEQV